MTDREFIEHQNERLQQKVNSWQEWLRQSPSYQELKIEQRQRDINNAGHETPRRKRQSS